MTALLAIEGLTVEFPLGRRFVPAVRGVDLEVKRGEIVGLVGESGCGKTLTALSVLRLVPRPGRITRGTIDLDGEDLLGLPPAELLRVRGRRVAMIFQEPMSALNPVYTIGFQIAEVIRFHRGASRGDALKEAAELLEMVAMPDSENRLEDFPHQLSGGQRQKAMIAIALACRPDLLIADEPTTALDAPMKLEVLDLLRKLRQELGLAVLFISHDLAAVGEISDRVAVMYAGQVVEESQSTELFRSPQHPYSRSLMAAVPRLGAGRAVGRLPEIPGQVPSMDELPSGCAFHPRCDRVMTACAEVEPELLETVSGRLCRCLLYSPTEGTEARA